MYNIATHACTCPCHIASPITPCWTMICHYLGNTLRITGSIPRKSHVKRGGIFLNMNQVIMAQMYWSVIYYLRWIFSLPDLIVISPALIEYKTGVNSEPETLVEKAKGVLEKEGKKRSWDNLLWNIDQLVKWSFTQHVLVHLNHP